MSTIYVGKSSRGQPVVVKEASGTDLEQSKERLRIETDILRSLSSPGHPRVVRYVDQATNLGPLCLVEERDRKSTRLNSSHRCISYAVFCLKKKKKKKNK